MDKITDQIKFFVKKKKTVMDKVIIIYTCLAILADIGAFYIGEGYIATIFLLAVFQILQIIRYKKQDRTEVEPYKMSAAATIIWFLIIVIKRIF